MSHTPLDALDEILAFEADSQYIRTLPQIAQMILHLVMNSNAQ